jgi:hypothetical protein
LTNDELEAVAVRFVGAEGICIFVVALASLLFELAPEAFAA